MNAVVFRSNMNSSVTVSRARVALTQGHPTLLPAVHILSVYY